MLTLPAAFLAAAAKSGHEPIWLVELPALSKWFATHDLDFKRKWRLGEGLAIGAGWRLGGVREPYDGRIAENGMDRIIRSLDGRGQVARIGAVRVELLNHDNIGATLNELAIDNTPVRVLMGWRDLPYHAFVELYRGVLDNIEETLTAYVLDVIDNSLRAHRDLSTPIGSQYFPGAPRSNRGKAIAIVIGRNTDIEALQVVGDAAGTLALTLPATATALYLAEMGASFPDTGTLTVGSETGVTYTSRDLVTLNGITYLRLSGLARSQPLTQNAGDAVSLTDITYTYLVGYRTGRVTAVRGGGVLIDPADYTEVVDLTSADGSVTKIVFSSAPAEPVRVDADGLNIEVDRTLTNGGFESGDTTGWTEVGRASLTVSTGETADTTSTYKGELTGSEDSWEDITHDFRTVIGRSYTVEFDYRDHTVSNLLTNADFSGGLMGWTLSPQTVNGQAIPQGDSGGFNSVSLSPVRLSHFKHHSVLYQDVPTTVSANYTLTFSYWAYKSTGPLGGLGQTLGGWSMTRAGWRVGSDAEDTLYDAQAPEDDTPWNPLGDVDWRTVTVHFTAQTATTRITFEALGTQDHYVLWPLYFRDIVLTQTTSLPTSASAYKLGTSHDDAAYAEVHLAPRYAWQRTRVTFQAVSETARLTLRSKWAVLEVSSWFDNVQLRDAGRNPAVVG